MGPWVRRLWAALMPAHTRSKSAKVAPRVGRDAVPAVGPIHAARGGPSTSSITM